MEKVTNVVQSCSLLERAYVWGAPAYVLDPTHPSDKMPRWKPRAYQGQFMGFSNRHSTLCPMIRNIRTGYISPCFNVVVDQKFETVASNWPDSWEDVNESDYFRNAWLEVVRDCNNSHNFVADLHDDPEFDNIVLWMKRQYDLSEDFNEDLAKQRAQDLSRRRRRNQRPPRPTVLPNVPPPPPPPAERVEREDPFVNRQMERTQSLNDLENAGNGDQRSVSSAPPSAEDWVNPNNALPDPPQHGNEDYQPIRTPAHNRGTGGSVLRDLSERLSEIRARARRRLSGVGEVIQSVVGASNPGLPTIVNRGSALPRSAQPQGEPASSQDPLHQPLLSPTEQEGQSVSRQLDFDDYEDDELVEFDEESPLVPSAREEEQEEAEPTTRRSQRNRERVDYRDLHRHGRRGGVAQSDLGCPCSIMNSRTLPNIPEDEVDPEDPQDTVCECDGTHLPLHYQRWIALPSISRHVQLRLH